MAAPMSTGAGLHLAIRGSTGICVTTGIPTLKPCPDLPSCASRQCKVMAFSMDGSHFAFCDGKSIKIYKSDSGHVITDIAKPRTVELKFSPKNSVLATWEPYAVTKEQPNGFPNLNLWDVKSGNHIRGFVHRKQTTWAPQWSLDESVCAKSFNNEVHFFEKNSFETTAQRLHVQKVSNFAIPEKCSDRCHVAVYVHGTKGQPSFARVFLYPNFGGPQAALANKSFYKADKVDMLWNNAGTALLVLTGTESSADSYYGEQGLHFISVAGESCLVPRAKDGPVYSVEWNPRSTEFCAVYGSMPAKATLYNMKCEAIFDFGTGPRNTAYFNPHGNVLCLAGFGNLQGRMEFWDPRSQRLISRVEAADSTFFEWSPDGYHIITATTAPRLRVGNGFRLWNFLGSLLYEQSVGAEEELWEVAWRPVTDGLLPVPPVPSASAAAPKVEVKKAYVPPAMRDRGQAAPSLGSKYRDGYEPPSNVKDKQAAAENMSKNALKNKKKREAKAKAKEQEREETGPAAAASAPAPVTSPAQAPPPRADPSGDPDRDKRIRNLRKKLQQVEKLKEQQKSGKTLEKNQLEKLSTEKEILEQLQELELG